MRARKTFSPHWLANLVHFICTGAPNPYAWDEEAVRAAACRRRILAALVEVWFEGRLRLPELHGFSWNREARAFALETELIVGRHAALRHMFSRADGNEVGALWTRIMRPLQSRLIESGFDGLLWQAGRGHPVASGNYMLDTRAGGGGDAGAWVWIDLESGVPAIFPLNPWALITFYLPRSFRHGGLLFDDVDVAALRAYLSSHEGELDARLGEGRAALLLRECDELAQSQASWKGRSRLERSIGAAWRRGWIDDAQAAWFHSRPIRWYAALAARGLRHASRWLAALVAIVVSRRAVRFLRAAVVLAARFLFSQRYRERLGRLIALRRLRSWRRRRQLEPAEGSELRRQMREGSEVEYVCDFGIHMAIKGPTKFVSWIVLPALVSAGVLSPAAWPVGVAIGGCVARTLYTTYRIAESTIRRRPRPWLALLVGLLPAAGNAAFPVQIIAASTGRRRHVGQFLIYDVFTTIGRRLPVWGGRDTMTEHLFNRLPDLVLRRLRRP
jgi:hypothetical protein